MGAFMINTCSGVIQRKISGKRWLVGKLGSLVTEILGYTLPNW